MDMTFAIRQKCPGCNIYLINSTGRKKLIASEQEANIYSISLQRTINVGDIICKKCRLSIYRQTKSKETPELNTANDFVPDSIDNNSTFEIVKSKEAISEVERVEVFVQRTIATHKACCICGSTADLRVIPEETRIQSYIKTQIYIPSGNRCCRIHLINNRIYAEDLVFLKAYSNTTRLTVSELSKIMGTLSIRCDSTLHDKVGEYSISEKQLKVFTGLNWEQLNELKDMLTSLRNSHSRSVIQALVVFLLKLRSGNSNATIASILQLQNEHDVSDYSASVMKSFENDVLPIRFGINAVSRDELIQNHTTEMAKQLYNAHDKLFLICDGTYARHQKSTNNEYQRKSFSGQKKVPLCKPFTICTTDGFVVDMLGPFFANQNDAQILESILEDPESLSKVLNEGDIFILDRGFRDIKDKLEEKNFRVLMPALKGKRKQLTTEESNDSRFVTKLRWAVESVHGIIKQKYSLLDHKIDNKLIPKIGSYFRIVCFLNNTFGKRLQSDVGTFNDIFQRMQNQKNVKFTLADEVEEKGWLRRKLPFGSITSNDLTDFPELTENDLKILFTGSYQLAQAVSYLAEMLDKDGNLKIEFVKDDTTVLKFKVPSRHISRQTYRCFIKYEPNNIGISGVREYICECANGRRTVGCCSHIAAVIYYLSNARYLSRVFKPAEILTDIFTKTKLVPVIESDSDED